MTSEEYRAKLKTFGLRFKQHITPNTDAYINRDNEVVPMPNPDKLSDEERESVINLHKDGHALS